MSTDVDAHWLRHEGPLERYRVALEGVVSVLAGGAAEGPALRAVLDLEPDPATTAPAVDPQRVDLGRLARALEGFWTAYYALPVPPGCEATRFTWRHLPARLARRHRAVLDQGLRVLLALFGARGSRDHARLQGLLWGSTHRLPGIEDLADRYSAAAVAESEARTRRPE